MQLLLRFSLNHFFFFCFFISLLMFLFFQGSIYLLVFVTPAFSASIIALIEFVATEEKYRTIEYLLTIFVTFFLGIFLLNSFICFPFHIKFLYHDLNEELFSMRVGHFLLSFLWILFCGKSSIRQLFSSLRKQRREKAKNEK